MQLKFIYQQEPRLKYLRTPFGYKVKTSKPTLERAIREITLGLTQLTCICTKNQDLGNSPKPPLGSQDEDYLFFLVTGMDEMPPPNKNCI